MSLKLLCMRFIPRFYKDYLCLALEKAVKGSGGIIFEMCRKYVNVMLGDMV